MEFAQYTRLLARIWALILGLAVLGAVVGGAVAALQRPVYQATATSFLTTPGGLSLPDLSAGVSYVQAALRSYAALATTASVLDPVIEEEDLKVARSDLASRIQVEAREQQSLLLVTVSDSDPRRAAAIANAVSAEVSRVGTPAGGAVGLDQVDPAVAPSSAVSPRPLLSAILGGVAGIVLAVVIGLVRELTDGRVRERQDLERITQVPVLGETSHSSSSGGRHLVMLDDGRSRQAEEYRTIRTNLGFALEGAQGGPIVVTSPDDGEGKSTFAANLALSVARLGKQVVLVDADLRRPALATLFGVEPDSGLTEVLFGASSLADAVLPIGDLVPLHLLTAGHLPQDPNELLQSTAMDELLEQLQTEYDLVLIDAPPLLPVSDAVVLGMRAGSALLVCAAGRTRRDRMVEGLEVLDRSNARALGVVLSMVPRKDAYGADRRARRQASSSARAADPFWNPRRDVKGES